MTFAQARSIPVDPDALAYTAEMLPLIHSFVRDTLAQMRPEGEWDLWTDADIERNGPELAQVVRQKLVCARCPGTGACTIGRTVARQIRQYRNAKNQRRIALHWGYCALARREAIGGEANAG